MQTVVERRDGRGVRLLSTREYGEKKGMDLDYVGELCRTGRLNPPPVKEDPLRSRGAWLIPEDAEVVYQDPEEVAERRRRIVAGAREAAASKRRRRRRAGEGSDA